MQVTDKEAEEIRKRQERAARFGIPLVESKAKSEPQKQRNKVQNGAAAKASIDVS